ncbi:pantoate--beta-alanine ligase [Sphingosinicella sp. CPCC 101087]|uniref:pantoate--beta-alanine ligase n=1 Tax=Sphingosinicella sp. CPCC 101087 TaxID=2497754 RepID=UPI00101C85D9|nr:pantoate--beta-alanine ligase [Sphingosinicella sp. CPCC 101087]
MQIIREVAALRRAVAALRDAGGPVALVPTMGALHAGHMALVAEALRHAPSVVASIFVNPMQFGAGEDLATYPRREAEDAAMLEEAGCALLWAPGGEAMYPAGFATTVSVAGVSEGLCGAARPGHFNGVATVVAKLLNQVRPDVALFGEKDYQQLAVIRRMVADLDLAVEIIGVPTVREADGLALSSRNLYLSAGEREAARALPAALAEAAAAIAAGGAVGRALGTATAHLAAAGFDPIDYVELRDAETLAPVDRLARPARLLAAARMGRTRLIDNVPVVPPAGAG